MSEVPLYVYDARSEVRNRPRSSDLREKEGE